LRQPVPAPATPGPADTPLTTADPPPSLSPAAQQEEPAVDIERLIDLAGGEMGLRELTDLYLGQTTEQMESLKLAVEAGAVQEVERIAHKSAGASATCGMNAIVAPLRKLERQGHEGRLSDAATLVSQASKELERIRIYLNNRRRS
jgi:HPt (histidine-containing phosphotransfer) domain-containing protein